MDAEELRHICEIQGEFPGVMAVELAKYLEDFGYHVPPERVKTEVDRLLRGGEPAGGLSVFLRDWLDMHKIPNLKVGAEGGHRGHNG